MSSLARTYILVLWALDTFENMMKALYLLSREVCIYAEFDLQFWVFHYILLPNFNLGLEEELMSGKTHIGQWFSGTSQKCTLSGPTPETWAETQAFGF